jgi:hypothetical protein
MTKYLQKLQVLAMAALALWAFAPATAAPFSFARIYIEYNDSANDLGFHVTMDGPNWKTFNIVNPNGVKVWEVTGRGAYEELGMTELFFEGAEPNLDDFPLNQLLARFPEGAYRFTGIAVSGSQLRSVAMLSHAIPDGPEVSAEVNGDEVVIRWEPVTSPPEGFPNRRIEIVGYQVIVESFQVTLPATAREVEVPEEYVRSLPRGEIPFEVLAIERSANQSITEGTFELD